MALFQALAASEALEGLERSPLTRTKRLSVQVQQRFGQL